MALKESVIKVLIIDDDEDDFFITSDYMKGIEEYKLKIDWSYKFNEAVQLLRDKAYDIYFVDYRLGAKTGLDFLREANRIGAEEPVILLTGKGNKTIDVEAMQMGATDYLIKTELTTEKLERCIRYSLERTAYLRALRANENKYRSIFELSKDAVFIADRELTFKDCNPTTSALLGYDKEELRELSLYDLISDETDKALLRSRVENEGQVADLEAEIRPKEGEKKSCVLSVTPAVDKEGSFQGFIHDITNLRRAEKANLMVEKLGATGRLVRTLAHEVRNPLNNINMSVEQLAHNGSADAEENTLFLDIIQRNSKRIGDIITELLDSARPTELTFDRHSLQSIMDEAIAEGLDRITLQHINMQIRYANQPCYVMANREKLRIAFLNIIINAVEAMEPAKGILSIAVESGKDGQAVVTIRDNGCGIPEENVSRLFEPYFTSKRNGMGLGLAATLNILQSHRANIDVNSIINQGTTFTISFPAS